MKVDFDLDTVDSLILEMGKTYRMQSVTHPLTREFFMMRPEILLPDFISLEKEEGLDMEGTHGCIYTLKAKKPGKGTLISSIIDLKSGVPAKEKKVTVEVT
ncbi:hypothetical protein [Algoriphagus confluentis]|uniref:Uncharacterized protein n=1 Tax=Algoriphagus confluentis TaxID=1697556 RepID=A0ABQ6PLB1_9BACT|nr:hypothetical protein Aconfl_10540 [Algoriphagus confluentis]